MLVDHLQDGIYVIADGRIDYANRQLALLLGYPVECLTGRKFIEVVAERDRQLILERYHARLSGENVPQQYDIHLLTAEGREVCCALNNYLMHLSDGGTVIIGSARDISRQITERTELEKSQLELQAIFDKLPDVFYRTDMLGMITMISPSCFDILGYRQESMMGTPMASYYESPDDRLRVVQSIVDGNGSATKVEAALRHRNGNRVWISTNAVIRLGEDGKPYCIEGVARDITERKGMEDMLTALSQIDPMTGIYNRRYFMDGRRIIQPAAAA